MSAFVVSNEHISEILSFLYFHYKNTVSKRGSTNKEPFLRLLHIAEKEIYISNFEALEKEDFNLLGNFMLHKNIISVNCRYEEYQDETPLISENFSFSQEAPDTFSFLKLVDSLNYQSCEEEDYFSSDFFRFISALREFGIRSNENYRPHEVLPKDLTMNQVRDIWNHFVKLLFYYWRNRLGSDASRFPFTDNFRYSAGIEWMNNVIFSGDAEESFNRLYKYFSYLIEKVSDTPGEEDFDISSSDLRYYRNCEGGMSFNIYYSMLFVLRDHLELLKDYKNSDAEDHIQLWIKFFYSQIQEYDSAKWCI
jgi:hypothetical protein